MTYKKAKTISIIVTLCFIFITYTFVRYINKQSLLLKYPIIEETSTSNEITIQNKQKYEIIEIKDTTSEEDKKNNISSYEYKVKVKNTLSKTEYKNIANEILYEYNSANKGDNITVFIYDNNGREVYSCKK